MADKLSASSEASLPEKDTRPPHLAAWHDAKTDEERRAAVKKHPKLAAIYSEAGKFLAVLAVVVGLWVLSFGIVANAQTIGSGTAVTGTTNAPLTISGQAPFTNQLPVLFPTRSVLVSGITETNETIVFSYGFQLAGTTNVLIVASMTNKFLTGTNSGSWFTNFPAMNLNAPIIPYAQMSIGSNFVTFPVTNTVFVN